jgi:hypothetical protein
MGDILPGVSDEPVARGIVRHVLLLIVPEETKFRL